MFRTPNLARAFLIASERGNPTVANENWGERTKRRTWLGRGERMGVDKEIPNGILLQIRENAWRVRALGQPDARGSKAKTRFKGRHCSGNLSADGRFRLDIRQKRVRGSACDEFNTTSSVQVSKCPHQVAMVVVVE